MANILLIEDDSYLADDLKYFIEDNDNRCEIYKYADQVMRNLDNLARFDTIILDIMLMRGNLIHDKDPKIETGEILFQEIRKKYPKKKIIIISAKHFRDMHINFSKAADVETIEKPIDEITLNKLLNLL